MIKHFLSSFFLVCTVAAAEPAYIDIAIYDSIKSHMPKPPAKGSKAERKDEADVRRLQKIRTKKDCTQANLEAKADIKALFGPPIGPLTEKEIESVTPLLMNVRKDISPFIGGLKKDFPRLRPHLHMKGIEPCVPKDDSGAFPSGHGVISKLYALILADLYPAYKSKLDTRAVEIGHNRVLAGAHFPSDIESGRMLADLLYPELKKSPGYQTDKSNVERANLKSK